MVELCIVTEELGRALHALGGGALAAGIPGRIGRNGVEDDVGDDRGRNEQHDSPDEASDQVAKHGAETLTQIWGVLGARELRLRGRRIDSGAPLSADVLSTGRYFRVIAAKSTP